jgi:hypothetical protein
MSDLVICVETFVRDGVPPGICTLVDEILCGEIALRGVSPEPATKDVHTQTYSTASRCRASVVRKNIVLLTLARALSLCSTFCVNECKKKRALDTHETARLEHHIIEKALFRGPWQPFGFSSHVRPFPPKSAPDHLVPRCARSERRYQQ